MEIRKIENKDYVMLPRLQHPGLKPKHVERDAFKAELKHIEGHGDYWLLYQQDKPHVVVHVVVGTVHWVFIKSHGLSSAYILLDSFQLHPECGVVTCGYL